MKLKKKLKEINQEKEKVKKKQIEFDKIKEYLNKNKEKIKEKDKEKKMIKEHIKEIPRKPPKGTKNWLPSCSRKKGQLQAFQRHWMQN